MALLSPSVIAENQLVLITEQVQSQAEEKRWGIYILLSCFRNQLDTSREAATKESGSITPIPVCLAIVANVGVRASPRYLHGRERKRPTVETGPVLSL